MSDPNGWVQNPPSVFVKVHGTSRDALNGKLGLVLQYAADRGRYTVLMCESQDPVSLKVDNLMICNGVVDKARAYVQMMRNNPDVRRQFQLISQQIYQRTGIKPEYALAALAVALIGGWYMIGFSKLLMVLTVLIMVSTVVGPDLLAGKDVKTVLRNAPNRWREVVRQQIPVVGGRIASNTIFLNLFTFATLAFVAYTLVASPAGRAASAVPRSAAAPAPSRSLSLQEDLQQQYYKLGFDDATNAREFGASLVKTAASSDISEAGTSIGGVVADDDESWRNASYDSVPTHKKKSPLSLSTAFAAFTIYRTLQPLAVNADGRFDAALFRANLVHLEVWKMGIVGFSAYRLVSAFL